MFHMWEVVGLCGGLCSVQCFPLTEHHEDRDLAFLAAAQPSLSVTSHCRYTRVHHGVL